LQLLFYAAPIVYSPDAIPSNFQWILKYNPMTYIINAYRNIFYYQTAINIKSILILIVIGIISCIFGYGIFSKLQKGFAEQL
jgi:ABC-2 type transport system permease protein